MIDRQDFSDQPVKNNLITYDNIGKISACQEDDYTTICLQDYLYFKEYHKKIAIDLRKSKHLMLIRKQYNKLILQVI